MMKKEHTLEKVQLCGCFKRLSMCHQIQAKQPTESGPKKKIEKDTHTEIALKSSIYQNWRFLCF